MGFGADHGQDEKKIIPVTPLSAMIRAVYEKQVRFLYPEEVEKYGIDAVWEALGKIGQEEMRRETGLPL